jgi:CheY-like chemotaxis protein
MPEMDGIELLAQVRDRFPGVRCVLHTGEAPEMTRHLGLQVLTKPCLPSALSELVLSLVEPASPPTKP